jgi:hypothetical protein
LGGGLSQRLGRREHDVGESHAADYSNIEYRIEQHATKLEAYQPP